VAGSNPARPTKNDRESPRTLVRGLFCFGSLFGTKEGKSALMAADWKAIREEALATVKARRKTSSKS
ncbi:MAG: hypothetical protein ABW202_19690, partial [Duganella sp.]